MNSETTNSNHGPELLDERSIAGILVHPLAFLTGGIAALLVYLVSSHEYTRANARNAANWYLSVFVLSVVAVVTFFLGADELTVGGETTELSLLPEPLDTILFLVAFPLLLALAAASMLTMAFALIATIKAIFGTAWRYPLARDLLGLVE